MDLTNFSGLPTDQKTKPETVQRTRISPQSHGENLKVPQSEEAKRFRDTHFNIMGTAPEDDERIAKQGVQVSAGVVDEEQTEFLKTTEFVD